MSEDDFTGGLLGPADPHPVHTANLGASSPLLLVGDHAGRAIPVALGDLGLTALDRARHIAWDIGVEGLGLALSARLDATFISQRYSRLAIDCNRTPGVPSSIAPTSDGSPVPGNVGVSDAAKAARVAEIFQPYHDRIAAEMDVRCARGQRTILVSLHSFTPRLADGAPRPWRFGVLHRHDSAYCRAVLAALRAQAGETPVGDNQPYALNHNDYTVPFHADRIGCDYLELEVRQDLLGSPQDQASIADEIAGVLAACAEGIGDRR